MANSSSSNSPYLVPNSGGQPEVERIEEGEESRHTAKFHRCLGHLRASNQHYGKSVNPYAACTASIGYSGSYTKAHRGGARTPGGREKKLATGAAQPAHQPKGSGVHWKPETEAVMAKDLATKWQGRRRKK